MLTNRSNEEALELIEELELSEPSRIARVQVRDSIEMRVAVKVDVGNASGRASEPLSAETREVSRQRIRIIASAAFAVGDIYRIRFDGEDLAVGDTYSLCMSCRLLGDKEFEAQFDFFAPIDLPQESTAGR